MRMTILFTILAAIVALVTAASADQVSKDLYIRHNFRYTRPEIKMLTPEEFMILPWGWTPGDAQILKEIKDCGFNMAGFVTPEYVDAVRKAGLKCFVSDPNVSPLYTDGKMSDAEIKKRVGAMTAKFRDNPSVYGYYMIDEPSALLFPALGRWADAIRKAHPGSTPYINLLPIGTWPGSKDYDDYLDQFVKQTHSTYVCYDHYTLMNDGSVRPSLYQNLEVMREFSLKHRIPFWNIVLSNTHLQYAEVTQGGLNLQVFATLAYGGRGISYFTYFAPIGDNIRNAPLDQFLNRTPTWDMIRLINLQIHKLGPTYLKLKSVNVFHNQDVPEGCRGMDSSKHLSEVSGGNFLIGEFVGPDNEPFVYIVNKDIRNSTGFHVKFKKEGGVVQTSSFTGEFYQWGAEDSELSPGCGALLSLKKQ